MLGFKSVPRNSRKLLFLKFIRMTYLKRFIERFIEEPSSSAAKYREFSMKTDKF